MNTTSKYELRLWSFYFIHDGSKSGHPGILVWKDDEKNKYLFVKFDSDKPGDIPKKSKGTRHITKLKHPISKEVVSSYAKNRPFLCKRKDIWKKELIDLKLHVDDYQTIMDIAKRNPILSTSIKK